MVGEHVSIGARTRLLAHVVVNGHRDRRRLRSIRSHRSARPRRTASIRRRTRLHHVGSRTTLREYVSDASRDRAKAKSPRSATIPAARVRPHRAQLHGRQLRHDVEPRRSSRATSSSTTTRPSAAWPACISSCASGARDGRRHEQVTRDVPPFFLSRAIRPQPYGLNSVGLRRAGSRPRCIARNQRSLQDPLPLRTQRSQAIEAMRERSKSDGGASCVAFLEAPSNAAFFEVALRRMRVFFSTGEPSGELTAAVLAGAMRAIDPSIAFRRHRRRAHADGGLPARARSTRGWASMGPLEALRAIPKLLVDHAAPRRCGWPRRRPT